MSLDNLIEEQKMKVLQFEDSSPGGASIINCYVEQMDQFLTTVITEAYEEEKERIRESLFEWIEINESWDEWGKENPHIFANELRDYLRVLIPTDNNYHSELDQTNK